MTIRTNFSTSFKYLEVNLPVNILSLKKMTTEKVRYICLICKHFLPTAIYVEMYENYYGE